MMYQKNQAKKSTYMTDPRRTAGSRVSGSPGRLHRNATTRDREQRYETKRNRVIRMAMDRRPNPAARGVRHA